MSKLILFLLTYITCTTAFALPVITLYQDDLNLQSSVEFEDLDGETTILGDSYSGSLLNNVVSASAINARYNIVEEYGNNSVISVARALNPGFTGDNSFSLTAAVEVYSWSGGVTGSINSVSSIYASATSSLLFDVEGGNVDFWAGVFEETPDGGGYVSLYDVTLDNLVFELQFLPYPGFTNDSALLLEGHRYALYAEVFDAHDDDGNAELDFRFGEAMIVSSVPEPSTLLLMAVSMVGLAFSGQVLKRDRKTHDCPLKLVL